jgi:hypothetical protein
MSNPSASPIVQTNNSKYVSIIPDNGTEFNPQQKIIFNIDPSVGFIKARDSYIAFDILDNATNPIRRTLNNIGISSIVDRVDIYSKHNGMLLESLTDYNKWVGCELPYRLDDNTNLVNIEGGQEFIECWANVGNSKDNVVAFPNQENRFDSPAHQRITPVDEQGRLCRAPVRFCMPLRCGIFRYWDDEVLVPILQMGGLRVEITLATGDQAFQQVGSQGATYESDGFAHLNTYLLATGGGALASIPFDNVGATDTHIDLSDTELSVQNCGLAVGNEIVVFGTGHASGNKRTITAMSVVGNKVRLTLNAAFGAPSIADNSGVMGLHPDMYVEDNLKYKITNAEFKLLQVLPPNQKMSDIDYVFTSYDVFKDTIPQTQTSFNQDITSVASKALSIFTTYEDPATLNNPKRQGRQEALNGLPPNDNWGFNLNSVVYFINNKLYPLNPYNPQEKADRVITLNELVKAFGSINIPVKSLGSGKCADLGIYTNRFIHARELARGNSVFNLQNAEPQIRLGFSGARGTDIIGDQLGNVRMVSFVFSKKVLRISGETGLSLEH